jgi:periplasmic protein TonB
MIDQRDLPQRKSRFHAGLTAARWGAAALIVAGAHAGAVWAALNWREAETPPSEPPPAVMIDLAPVAVAPSAPPQEVAPGPQQTEAELQPTPDPTPPIDEPKPDPTPPIPTQEAESLALDPAPPKASPLPDLKPDPAPPAPPMHMKIPDLPKNEEADAVLAPPPPPPPEPKAQKKPPAKAPEAERKKPVRLDKKRVLQTTAPPAAEARQSTAAAAPAAGAASQASVAPASWKGDLVAHLNRYKRYPAGAVSYGTASIVFTINRSGQVLSSRLIGSSGDHALDEEAVSLPRRASPVPPPPPGMGGATFTLTVPVRFNR